MNTKEIYRALATKRAVRVDLLRHPDVVGIGVGPKEIENTVTNETAIKLYVRRKKKEKSLDESRLLPEKLENHRTDVVEIAPLRARGFVNRMRPLLGGTSGAVHVPGLTYTGTLGMAVRGAGDLSGRFFLLSNNHVIANVNQSQIGDPIIQPGTLDGGDPNIDVVGSLYDYVRLQFSDTSEPIEQRAVNTVDAALGEVHFGTASREIFWVGYPKAWLTKKTTAKLLEEYSGRLPVQKTGRTTAYTSGEVVDIAYDGWVNYDQGRLAWFEDQLLINPGSFSDSGDSGSVILDFEERVLGLLFAGGATHTIANHIEDVWEALPAMDFSDAAQ